MAQRGENRIAVVAMAAAAMLGVACLANTTPSRPPASVPAVSDRLSPSVRPSFSNPVATVGPPGTTPPSATPDPCGAGREALIARRVEIPEAMLVGGVRTEMTTHAIGLINGSYHATDSVPGGIGLEPSEKPSRAKPDGLVTVAAGSARLYGAQVHLGLWDEVTFEIGGGIGNPPEERIDSTVRIEGDGSAVFSTPHEADEYVATVAIDWQSTCLDGHSIGYARIVVR